MLKLLVVLVVGYLLFKIIKNAAIVTIENKLGKFRSKQLNPTEDLVQCTQCGSFISREIVKTYKKNDFCSKECIDEFKRSN